jgi:hypothetical protein
MDAAVTQSLSEVLTDAASDVPQVQHRRVVAGSVVNGVTVAEHAGSATDNASICRDPRGYRKHRFREPQRPQADRLAVTVEGRV